MKIRLKFKIGSREVSRGQWEEHIRKSMTEHAAKVAMSYAQALRCPQHGAAPTVTYSLGRYQIKACCDVLMSMTKRVLNG